MTKKNILLTGASGTVGFEALLQLIDKKSYNVTVFDLETKQSLLKLLPYKDQVNLLFGDISNPKDLEPIQDIDFVIHLAAIIPPVADDFPELAKKVNLTRIGEENTLRQSLKLNEDYAIEGNFSNKSKFDLLKLALNIFDLEDELSIKYIA